MSKKKVILSLDGGALKGIIQLKILENLKEIVAKQKFETELCNSLGEIVGRSSMDISKILHKIKSTEETKQNILEFIYESNFREFISEVSINQLCNGIGDAYDMKNSTYMHRDKIVKAICSAFDSSQKSIMDYIDIVGGVSIGSVIAAGPLLKNESGSYKYSISDCIEMLKTLPEKVFEKNWLPFFKPVLNGNKVLEGFKKAFGESTFKDLVGDKKLFISSTNLDTCKNTIWTNLVDSKAWDMNFKNNSSLKEIRYVDVSDVKLYDPVNSSSSYLMALPAHQVKYKLLSENEAKDRTEADGCYINVTPHLDLLSTLSVTGTKIQDMIMIGIGTGRCDFDGRNLAGGSPYSYVKDILSDQNFTSGTFEARQDNTSRAVDNIIRSNGGQSYLFDVPISENQYKNSFDTVLIPQYIDLADKWCTHHMSELAELAQVLIHNACED